MADQANGWFYKTAVENAAKSKEAKRAIFDEKVYVQITIPGDNKFKFVDLATDEHKARFPAAWAQYEALEEQVGEGTPLEEWAMMTVGKVKELKSLNIHTVEQLAGLTDQFIGRLGMGARDLVEQAKVRLVSSDTDAEQLAQQVVDMKARVAELEDAAAEGGSDGSAAKVTELTEQLAAVTTERDGLKDEVKFLTEFIEAEGGEVPTREEAPEGNDDAAKEAEKAEKTRLRDHIKEQTGETVKGNPSLNTLHKMAEDLTEG